MDEPLDRNSYEDLVILLGSTGADLVLIGGVAIVLSGFNRFTEDVDFAFRRTKSTIRAIVEALAPFHPRPLGFPADLPFVWDEMSLGNMATITLTTDLGRIDFLSEPDGIDSFEGLFSRAVPVDLGGVILRVSSVEDLLAMKRAAGRPKDLGDIAALESIKRVTSEENPQ